MKRALVLVAVAACASPKPWRATATVATTFEGKRLEYAIGYAVEVHCTEKLDPVLYLCPGPRAVERAYALRVRWGERTLSEQRSDAKTRPVAIAARRMSKRLIALQLATNDPATRDAWRFLAFWRSSQRFSTSVDVHLPPGFTLAGARDQAIRDGWKAIELVRIFGRDAVIDEHAVTQRDTHYLRSAWLTLAPALQQRALADAIAARDGTFLLEHWRWLGPPLLAPAVDALVDSDGYALLAEASWWRTLSPALQTHLVERVMRKPESGARTRFLAARRR